MFKHLMAWLFILVGLGIAHAAPPNVVIFFLDDSGYADFQPFGEPAYATPNVEQLAAEGVRFTRFYVPQGEREISAMGTSATSQTPAPPRVDSMSRPAC